MIHHIMRNSADAANRQFETLDRIAQNVGNMNTNGYKVKSFQQFLRYDGQVAGVEQRDFTQGALRVTGRETDIAVDGNGFIPVTKPDGTIAYTRDGSFTKNKDGFLITYHGDLVGNGIQLPLNYDKLIIDKDGTVQVRVPGEMQNKTIGQIKLVNFANPEGLQYIGDNKLAQTVDSGPALAVDPGNTKIRQGSLERSNVNMYYQIDQILRLNASLLSNMRIVRFSDDIYRQAVNLRQ